MRVISGKLKGREVPFINAKFDDANVTPQKIKKALFSYLGEDLSGTSFLDLYSCSGQIGLEAISRDAGPVVFNELDKRRYNFIKSLISDWELDSGAMIFNYHAFRCLRYLGSKGLTFDYIFIDPPYPDRNILEAYESILDETGKYAVLKDSGRLIFQHSSRIKMESVSSFRLLETKRYAGNSLSVFAKSRIFTSGDSL